MKTLLLCLLLSVPTLAQVNVTYDKFKDETLISTDAVKLDRSLSMSVRGLQKGQSVQYYLIFWSHSPSWRYLRSHGLIFLADGERVDLGNGKHDGKVERYATVTETMFYLISKADLETLNKSTSLEMKLGFFEVAFKPGHRQGIKEMLGYVVK